MTSQNLAQSSIKEGDRKLSQNLVKKASFAILVIVRHS